MKIAVVLLLAVVCVVSAIVCPERYCDGIDCGSARIEKDQCEQNENGVFVEKGTFCGCCPACLTKICKSSLILLYC